MNENKGVLRGRKVVLVGELKHMNAQEFHKLISENGGVNLNGSYDVSHNQTPDIIVMSDTYLEIVKSNNVYPPSSNKTFWQKYIKENPDIPLMNETEFIDVMEKGSFDNKDDVSPEDIIQRGFVYATKVMFDEDAIKLLKEKYIAFDVETTGLNYHKDKIIEVGAVLFEHGKIVKKYNSLINIGSKIPSEATKVNHITNDMISSAPSEKIVYRELVNFLGDCLQEETAICAHNAKFDMDFLSETLERMGYNGKIYYVDTLSVSRKLIKDLDNYKQDTLASHFGFINQQSHRAVSDAETCGKILAELIKLKESEIESKRKALEKTRLDEPEKEICAFLQDIIVKSNNDIDYLGFYKNSSGYVDVSYMYSIIKFKISKKGKYIIIDKSVSKKFNLPTEPCSVTEGGSDYVRLYFNTPFELENLSDYFIKKYKSCRKSALGYLKHNSKYKEEIMYTPAMMNRISLKEMQSLIESARQRTTNEDFSKLNKLKNQFQENIIKREEITINPVNNRVPLTQIKNSDNWNKGFEEGYKYWEQGDKLRKEGNIREAIEMFDKSRYYGYCSCPLFESYALAYHKLKDYDNEIDILDEGIKRAASHDFPTSQLEARLSKAVQLFYKEQQEKLKKEEKRIANEKNKAKKEVRKENKQKAGRPVLQMNENLEIIQRFETITEAVRITGINSKSIRDAAKGIQKHAGGFIWKYADDIVESE